VSTSDERHRACRWLDACCGDYIEASMFYSVSIMERVGIRDLKQNASAVVKRVEAGETVEITDRGRPVARIVALRHASTYERLVAEGRITPARGRLLDHRPLPPIPGRPLGSEALAGLRAGER